MQSNNRQDILNGSIPKQLMLFFFPVLLGYLFQQLYNTVDAIIVGTYVGKEALAAVGGTTGTSINLLVNFIWGLTSGVGVIVAQYYGARDFDGVHTAVKTGVFIGTMLGAGMTVLGIAFTPALLSLLNVPADVYSLSVIYMRIFLGGLVPLMIYNVGASILRATGDSKRPLYFLILSAIINTILDYIFVRYFLWGVAGAAIATVIAQVVCAILMLLLLSKREDAIRFEIKDFGYDKELLKKTIKIGFPAGVQSVVYSVSNLFIQASVNTFGTNTVAAYTAFGKLDGFYWNYDSAFGIAVMTIVGQNYGADNIKRVKQTVKAGILLEALGTIFFSGICYIFAAPLTGLFSKDLEVITIGVSMMRTICLTWILFTPIEILASTYKACGDSLTSMIFSAIGICGVRIIYILCLPHKNVLETLYCYPISWFITATVFIVYFFTNKWQKKKM